jgi:glutamate racemase
MENVKRPIGIFDSGVGGLTVAHAIRQTLPGETIIYFGDTAHLPYGDKSAEAIKAYSRGIINFLLGYDVKILLIACNSASASAYETLLKEFSDRIIILDVINPVVEYVASRNFKRVGVIGTKRTIISGTYDRMIRDTSPATEVCSLATPLLVPMIEEGFIFDDISNAIIRSYLSKPELAQIDSLILGCTHYPIIKNQINKFFNFNVDVIDSSKIVADHLRKLLTDNKQLNDDQDPRQRFLVSDYTDYFQIISKLFFEDEIELEKVNLWNA